MALSFACVAATGITVRPRRLRRAAAHERDASAVLVGDDDVVDAGAAARETSVASAVSTSPRWTGARKSTVRPAATVSSLRELQANAKAESASVVMKPPWQMSWPLSMSSRTVISSRAVPAPSATMRMPRPREARSAANMCAPTASARRRARRRGRGRRIGGIGASQRSLRTRPAAWP